MYGPGTLDEESPRRSIYFTMKRSKLIPRWWSSTRPDGTVGVGDRPSTTIAPQALHLMNNPHVRAAAHGFAQARAGRRQDRPTRTPSRAPTRWRSAANRPRTNSPTRVAFLKRQTGDARETALADFCQVLFCLNEFLYVE